MNHKKEAEGTNSENSSNLTSSDILPLARPHTSYVAQCLGPKYSNAQTTRDMSFKPACNLCVGIVVVGILPQWARSEGSSHSPEVYTGRILLLSLHFQNLLCADDLSEGLTLWKVSDLLELPSSQTQQSTSWQMMFPGLGPPRPECRTGFSAHSCHLHLSACQGLLPPLLPSAHLHSEAA